MNSLGLLLVILIGSVGVVLSYVTSWKSLRPENRPVLLGESTGCAAVILVISPCIASLAFVYSSIFYLVPALFTPAEATILGVAWGSGGEGLLCLIYGALLTFSAFWCEANNRRLADSNRSVCCSSPGWR